MKKLKACNEHQFTSPIVIIVKKDGSLKLALDSKKLNESVIRNKYQMPNIDESMDQMAQIVTSKRLGKVWYSSVDLIYGQLLLAWKQPNSATSAHWGKSNGHLSIPNRNSNRPITAPLKT